MATISYRKYADHGAGFWLLLAGNVVLLALGLGAAFMMEHNGHVITGMNNQIVWGMPHVFAVFLIVAASGALNVASISSVFGRAEYKPYARLSALLAIALLVGGLSVLVLDLGRPDRLIVAMTTYNFRSIFAWNIYLYVGFLGIVAAYLFVMMDRKVSRIGWAGKAAGGFAFVWRLVLTTGTGSIFGFLVARQAYDAAVLAPLFIAASLLYGLAITVLVLAVSGLMTRSVLMGDEIARRFRGLLAIFALVVLYFTAVHHLTNLYAAEHRGVERFLLLDGGRYTAVFWIGQVIAGGIVPLVLLALPEFGRTRSAITLASALFVIGGLAQMYVVVVGGQAYPLELFPGMEVTSSFHDGQITWYAPSWPEVLLGLSGMAIAMLVTGIAIKVLPLMPSPAFGREAAAAHGPA